MPNTYRKEEIQYMDNEDMKTQNIIQDMISTASIFFSFVHRMSSSSFETARYPLFIRTRRLTTARFGFQSLA